MHDENPTHAAPHSTTTQARHAAPSAVAGRDNRRRPHAKRKHQQKNARKPKGAGRHPHRSAQKMHPPPRSAGDQTSSRPRSATKQAQGTSGGIERHRHPQRQSASVDDKRRGPRRLENGEHRCRVASRGSAGLRPLVPLEARAKRCASQPQVARDQAQRASGEGPAVRRTAGPKAAPRSPKIEREACGRRRPAGAPRGARIPTREHHPRRERLRPARSFDSARPAGSLRSG